MNPTLDLSAAPPLAAEQLRTLLAGLLPVLLQREGQLLAIKDLASNTLVHVNEAMLGFLQRAPHEVLGHGDADVFDSPALMTALRAADHTAVAHGQALTSEHRFEWKGVKREFSVLRLATEADAQGRRWLCSVWTDLAPQRERATQLRQALEQIEQQQRANELLRREVSDQALRDPDSGLYRRAHFEDQLRREVDLSLREHREFSLVFIEVDPPPPKVLALGAAGTHCVLEAVGRLLRSGTRAMDASCRYDEQRFGVLLSGVGLATAHARMEGLRRKCAGQIVVHEGQELGFTVAMGVASFPHTAQTQEALVAASEAALAEARRRGGNHVTLAAIRFESD
ncbi:MAG: diguanylate cyclase [Burkholderiales bacterium]|nr:diguanylate cyclase [Burkholderiales bacterium]